MQCQDRTGRYDSTVSYSVPQDHSPAFDLLLFNFFQFLGDEETVRKAIESVAAQGKAKK